MKRFWGLFGLCLMLSWAVAQEAPLINYAAGIGECEHDEDPEGRGDNVVDGFSYGVSEEGVFVPVKDTSDYVSGQGSQRFEFSRNNTGTATARFVLVLRFPTEMYPQPGETVRISFWLKTANWQNARYRILAQDYNGNNTVTLLSSTDPVPNWTRFEYTFTIPNAEPNGMQLRFHIDALPGVSQGTFWVDNIEIYGSKRWPGKVQRSMKLFTYYHPTTMPLANHDWIFYGQNFDMLGTFNSTVYLRPMKVYNPELKTVAYYMAVGSVDAPVWPARDPFGYQYCNTNHPEWFALDLFGNRIRFHGNIYLMDIGNPACAEWAATNMRTRAIRANWRFDFFKLDGIVTFTNTFNQMRYPTPASRTAAMQKYLMKILELAEDFGTQLLMTPGSVPTDRGRLYTLLMRQGLFSGVLLEGAFTPIFSFPVDYLPYSGWLLHLNSIAEYPDKTFIVYSGYTLNPQRMRRMKLYALASFLLVARDNTYLYLDKHYYEGDNQGAQRAWRPDDDFNVPLGQPTGPFQVFFQSTDYQGGLYYRPFENGFVLVNPTGNNRLSVPGRLESYWKDGATFTWVLDDTYWELNTQQTYPAGTRIKLYPKESRIFVRVGQALRDYPPAQASLKALDDLQAVPVPKK
ncbi:MAG: putative glycoside hydrolase [Fimbriimonadales bacterium]|jgi:hypothetical protein|nr:putative glycoside hydrolase [Fimbriimonadales bacterium]GBC90543.1 hypothetical protein HRbin14_01280 [bacterium HR14]CUU00770.1 Carbohydrate binding domain-containing protein [Armatimonadetes bacterium GBS]CUU34819.1 Carbohydrate binding domain-containing protein [Armatimonadetes bacterium GXS]